MQLPLETPDALSVDCIYFPPMFSTCDGSRSDSRDDRNHDPTGPVSEQPAFGGATQNLRVNGAPLTIKGVNRHEHTAEGGKAVSWESMLLDATMLKAADCALLASALAELAS